jgi:AcrR family transcriptional regulator
MANRESRRAAERKREILAGASRAFRHRGLHATGMREIAAELGMQVGNLYYYFRNKQELLAFCQDETLSGLLRLAEKVEGSELLTDERLRRLIVGHVEQLNETTPGSLAHLEIEALDEEFRQPIQRRRDQYERVYRRILEEGVSSGRFRRLDPKIATRAILGAVNWTVKWFRPEGRQTATEIGEELATVFIRGLERGD